MISQSVSNSRNIRIEISFNTRDDFRIELPIYLSSYSTNKAINKIRRWCPSLIHRYPTLRCTFLYTTPFDFILFNRSMSPTPFQCTALHHKVFSNENIVLRFSFLSFVRVRAPRTTVSQAYARLIRNDDSSAE